jgi:hypothetical protein
MLLRRRKPANRLTKAIVLILIVAVAVGVLVFATLELVELKWRSLPECEPRHLIGRNINVDDEDNEASPPKWRGGAAKW